jgi:hypothetical protein
MMPQSAIASRIVDFIAPVPTLVQRIAEVAHSKRALHKLEEGDAEEHNGVQAWKTPIVLQICGELAS